MLPGKYCGYLFFAVLKQSDRTPLEGAKGVIKMLLFPICPPWRGLGGDQIESKIYVDGLSAPNYKLEREASGLAGARSLGTRILSPGSAGATKGWRGMCLKKNSADCNDLQSATQRRFFSDSTYHDSPTCTR